MMEHRKITVQEAADFIKNTNSALIVCHTNPDGDTVGSALALKEILSDLGARAKVAVPSEVPDHLKFLVSGEDLSYTEKDENGYEKIIAVDVASVGQLGALAHLAEKTDLIIDHHGTSEPFAPNLTVPEASAAGEVIFDIYERLTGEGAIASSPEICRYIFSAISADTGSFKYSNTTPKTFCAASRLSEEIGGADDGGLQICDISRLLHDTVTEKDLKINAAVCERIKLFEDGALAVCGISLADMEALGVAEKDLGGAVDIVRSLAGVLVAVSLRETAKGTFKISSRANGDIDVSKVCAAFGGGGHKRAAGASFCAASIEEALEKVTAAFSAAVSEYNDSLKKEG